ncbi:RNase H domain-containing protein [Trichonephila clavipes]|nr:RNase H domain-containing protein [Trichonephila clavipes]
MPTLIKVSPRVEEKIFACKQEKWAELCDKLDPRKELSITTAREQLRFSVTFYCSQTLDLRSRCVILMINSQLTQDIIAHISRVFAAQRVCSLQWIPAQVDIFGYEQADNLVKEARNSPQLSNTLTLTDADAIARGKLTSHSVKKPSISDLNCNRVISTTKARLHTRRFKGRKVSPDGQRSYNTCIYCSNIQFSPNCIFNYPSTLAKLHNVDLNPTDHQLLYSPKVVGKAKAVLDAFDLI